MEGLASLRAFLHAQARDLAPPLSSFYGLAARGADELLDPGGKIERFVSTNEIQVTAMLSSVAHWRTLRREPFRIVHDESRSLAKHSQSWGDPRRGRAFHGIDRERQHRPSARSNLFAQRTIGTRPRDPVVRRSRGLVLTCLSDFRRRSRPISAGSDAGGLGNAPCEGIPPSAKRISGPPPARSGPDLLDDMIGVMRPAIDEVLEQRERHGPLLRPRRDERSSTRN